MQLGDNRTTIAGPLTPAMGTWEEEPRAVICHLKWSRLQQRQKSRAQHWSSCIVPCHPNSFCAYALEDKIMSYPNLNFLQNSLGLGNMASFGPDPQCHPSMERLTDISAWHKCQILWAGQVFSFLSLSKKNKHQIPRIISPSWVSSSSD